MTVFIWTEYIWVFPKIGVPPKHPKMIIFSRKTHGCWVPPFLETSRSLSEKVTSFNSWGFCWGHGSGHGQLPGQANGSNLQPVSMMEEILHRPVNNGINYNYLSTGADLFPSTVWLRDSNLDPKGLDLLDLSQESPWRMISAGKFGC